MSDAKAQEIIGTIQESKEIKPLINVLDDEDKDVRKSAISSLSKFRDLAFEETIKALNNDSPIIRENAILVLGNLKNTKSLISLENMLSDKSVNVRKAAADSLIQIGDEGEEILLKNYNLKNKNARQTIAQKIGEISKIKSVKLLIELFEDKSKEVRQTALESIIKLGRIAVKPLISAINKTRIRIYVVKALGNIGEESAVDCLTKINLENEEWDVQESIKSALNKLGHKTDSNSLGTLAILNIRRSQPSRNGISNG